ncbi:hypothetical protein ITI46_16560 [Streptomyces oryzae]|uniref:Peptidase n=1 Tax=Streptomyces oryzae TaxID=1434886 RepID=A0ABS3XE08_9ACTN|nr:hypothetical protein [Streptomyces oryzae]MBO8193267.1 hypothetical protein [Streptomyces oryzae]
MKSWRSRVGAALAVGAAAIAIPLTAAGPASAADAGSPSTSVKYEWDIRSGGWDKQRCAVELKLEFEQNGAIKGYCFEEDSTPDQNPNHTDWAVMAKEPVK